MLQIGLTGGIGAGKSTVSRRLVELGAVLVDADLIAREVVAKGSEGLARIAEAFGPEVVGPDGEMDRPRVASLVFGDDAKLAVLNGITHPLIARRQAELVAAAGPEAVVVHDAALLVEMGNASRFPLVVVVHTDAEVRVRRLVESRGMSEEDARARIAKQSSDAERLAVADAVLDNDGTEEDLRARVDRLWHDRLVPLEENLRRGHPVRGGAPVLTDPEPGWAGRGARLAARVARAAGERGRGAEHIGSTAVPGLPAKDVTDLQLAVASLDDADALDEPLRAIGLIRIPEITQDSPKPADPDPAHWRKRYFAGADPEQRVHLHVRVHGSPGWCYALLFRDWLRADEPARAEYLQVKRAAAAEFAGDPDAARYVGRKESWFDAALPRAEQWAASTGWSAPY
ncbi:dephospho-CoA kinase [Pseudonocardia kujensis]|uniref:dephospho-CoA kinase n=1 Tax=Pseudonocardia kujensis TaxID=1128675 RepID=UPI001E4E11DD|nr:dephospho-CoA kinase [Pseudonocardia kujensis]MCE0767089.1 dephospho-CoA kinase [Pseudonocardia kujensis]